MAHRWPSFVLPVVTCLLCSSAFSPLQAQNTGNTTFANKGIATAGFNGETDKILDEVEKMDPDAAADIETAIGENGNVRLVATYNTQAVSDSDTIALPSTDTGPDDPNWYLAVMLLHEWWHVQGCELGPDGNDPRNDGPCGSCVEAQRGADDCNTAGSYICEYLPEDEQEDACYLWFKTYALTSAALNRCAYDGCPNVPNLSGLGIVLPPCCFD